MGDIKNKDLLISAINVLEIYTQGQKKLLEAVITLSSDGLINTTASELIKLTGFSRTLTHKNLKFLEIEKVLQKISNKKTNEHHFKQPAR